MPIQLNEEDGGKIVVVHISAKLTKSRLRALCARVRAECRAARKTAAAVRHDWFPRLGCWRAVGGHQVRSTEHFADIERLAMVGEKKWQHGMATFCKPFTTATIRYFDSTPDATEARKWLGEA